MKVMAVNSSPRGEGQSKTELMMNHLVEGMSRAGAEVETFHLREKKVRNCLGCFSCWSKTPGVCIQKDDMTHELFPRFIASDLVVLATPLYHYTMNGAMKTFVERTLPVIEPFIHRKNGRTFHPLRFKHPGVIVLSVAGFPEDSVFDQLSAYVNFLYGPGLLAEIYRPAAETMVVPVFKDKLADILAATQQAGKELVQSGKVAPETLARIKQPVGDEETMVPMANLFWKSCIEAQVTPQEFEEKGLVPRPDSIETFLGLMKMGFKPQAAADLRAVMQFEFSGPVQGDCHLTIGPGTIDCALGRAENPDLTVTAPFEIWMDIVTGQADGGRMFLEQKYQVSGDLSLLMRMNEIFGG